MHIAIFKCYNVTNVTHVSSVCLFLILVDSFQLFS